MEYSSSPIAGLEYLRSASIRIDSQRLVARVFALKEELRWECDRAQSSRLESSRLRIENLRLQALLHERQRVAELGRNSIDCEIFEDEALLAQVNEAMLPCSKCNSKDDPIAAIACFKSIDRTIFVCGPCFRELHGLSLGSVV